MSFSECFGWRSVGWKYIFFTWINALGAVVVGCGDDSGYSSSEYGGNGENAAGGGNGNHDYGAGADGFAWSDGVVFADDTTGPTILILRPTTGETLTGLTTVHVTAQDPSGVASVLVALNSDIIEDSHPNAAVFLGTCKTKFYSNGTHKLVVNAKDTLGNTTWLSVPVTIDNDAGTLVAGIVSVGAWVQQATVKIYDWTKEGKGGLVGQGLTDETGHFGFATTVDSSTGWGLVVVTGPGWFVHPETGKTQQMLFSDELTSLIPLTPGGFGDANVSAWTTMAVRLMEGLAFQGAPKSIQWPLAVQWISEHLQRPESFEIGTVPPKDPFLLEKDSKLSPGTIIELTQMALLRVADEEQSSIFEAAKKLGADLATDGMFNGHGRYLTALAPSNLLWNSGQPVDTEDTRYRLAAALADLVLDFEATREEWPTSMSYDVLNAPMGLLDTLSFDDGPLYPLAEEAPPHYFDHDPPVVQFIEPTPAQASWVGAGSTLIVVAHAKDKSPLMDFHFEFEPELAISDNWKISDDGKTITAEISGKDLKGGDLTVRAVAVDASRTPLTASADRVFQVDKTPPIIATIDPPNDPPLSAKTVELVVDVGDAESGVAKVDVTPNGCPDCGATAMVWDEAAGRWTGQVILWAEGTLTYVVEAHDNAGNLSIKSHTLVRDTVEPVMTAVKSEYVRALEKSLKDGTTALKAVWGEQATKTDLVVECDLGTSDAPHTCSAPLSIFVHEAACNVGSPTLKYDVDDVHLKSLSAHFEYGHIVGESIVKKADGTLAVSPKGALEIPLCSDTLGEDFAAPNVTHVVKFWVQDSAGNSSEAITVTFTVAWETPPLWIGPSKKPLDPWDLATYSFDDFTIHKPFAKQKDYAETASGHRMYMLEIINPHPVTMFVVFDQLAPILMELGMQRAYLAFEKVQQSSLSCKMEDCAYLYSSHPNEPWSPPIGACVSQLAYEQPVWTSTDLETKIGINTGGSFSTEVTPGTWAVIGPNTIALLSWYVRTANTCQIPPPSVRFANWVPVKFYQAATQTCDELGTKANGELFLLYEPGYYSGAAWCTENGGTKAVWTGYNVPLLWTSARARIDAPGGSGGVLLSVSYSATLQSASTRTDNKSYANDVVWSSGFTFPKWLKSKPYYQLPTP